MKVALVTPGGVDRSGTERVIPCLLWLIERFVRAGVEVHVYALRQEPEPGRWPLRGATVHNLGAGAGMPALWRALAAEHRIGRFDLVHCFWALPSGAAAALPARLLGIPLLLTLPGGDLVCDRAIGYGARLRWRDRVRLRLIVVAARAVVVPCRAVRAQAAALGITATRIAFGIATDDWPVRAPTPRDRATPIRLLHVASLNPVKDQATLLAAMARLVARKVRFTLDIIGEDILAGAVQRQAAALGLDDCIRFHGFLPHHALRRRVEQADLLVMSSRHEGAPIVLLEAAVAGVPTVGTAVGNIAELAPHAAVAVPVGDSDALADAVAALAQDEDARLRMAHAAQRCALAEDADWSACQYLVLYRALAAPRSRARLASAEAAHAAL